MRASPQEPPQGALTTRARATAKGESDARTRHGGRGIAAARSFSPAKTAPPDSQCPSVARSAHERDQVVSEPSRRGAERLIRAWLGLSEKAETLDLNLHERSSEAGLRLARCSACSASFTWIKCGANTPTYCPRAQTPSTQNVLAFKPIAEARFSQSERPEQKKTDMAV